MGDHISRFSLTLIDRFDKKAIFARKKTNSIIKKERKLNLRFFRLRLVKSPHEDHSSSDSDSIGSATVQAAKSSCFRCHPRRWRHQACCFRKVVHGSKTGQNHKKKSSFRARITTRADSEHSDPGSLLNTSTHELQVIPMGSAVASMISTVVNQSATMAASAAGGKVPPARSTFGKRNIKNQVNQNFGFDSLQE